MKKLTILLVTLITLFTCSNKLTTVNDLNMLNADNDINALLTGEFSIIEEINALSMDDKKNVLALALNVFHEARGEKLEGQIAVINVVLNRVKSDLYPDNIVEVVYQNKQFSWTLNDDRVSILLKEKKAWIDCQQIAFIVYTNRKYSKLESEFYLHYVNKDIVNKITWAKNFTKRKIIGHHIFLMKERKNA